MHLLCKQGVSGSIPLSSIFMKTGFLTNPVFRVLACYPLPRRAMNQKFVLLINSDDEKLRAPILEIAPDCEIITNDEPNALARAHVIYSGVKPSEIGDAQNLRWLQLFSAGVNRWPLEKLAVRGVQITTTSGIHAQPITEQMFGMLLMNTRALGIALREQPKGEWRGFDYSPRLQRIADKTLGVLGVGAIGSHAARVGRAFEMRVLGLRSSGAPDENVERMFTPDQKLEFFGQCDVVMNSLPLTENTRGFMGEAEFAALPDGAIVVNTGRGETIDTPALMAWLQSGRARAALLDVTEPEPLPPDHPLWQMENVFITPHYSGNHPDYGARADAIFLDNLRRFVKGEPLHNAVDAGAGY